MIPETLQQVSAGPTNPSVFSSACDDGRLLIYDPRDSTADKCQPYQSMCVFQEGSFQMIPEILQQVSAGPTNPSVFSSAHDERLHSR